MITGKIIIKNPLGLHALYASKLAFFAAKSGSSIILRNKKGIIVNASNMTAVLSLAVKAGETLEFFVDGIDEKSDAKKFTELLANLIG